VGCRNGVVVGDGVLVGAMMAEEMPLAGVEAVLELLRAAGAEKAPRAGLIAGLAVGIEG
jgi:hypothetical protein